MVPHNSKLDKAIERSQSFNGVENTMRYIIIGKCAGHKEDVDCAETRREAEYMLGEYRVAFGSNWVLWIEERGE